MRPALLRRGLIAIAILSCIASRGARGGELPREFKQQYVPAAEKLRDFYTNVTVSGKLKRELPQENKSVEQNFVFRAAGVQVRLDVSTVSNRGTGAQVGGSELFMATRVGSLTTIRNPGSEFFDDARELKYGETKSYIESTCLLSAPYTFGDYATIVDYLRQPNVRILSVKKVKRDSDSFVKVSFNEMGGSSGGKPLESWFLLSPSECWAIREYSRTSGTGAAAKTDRGTISYDGMQDGVPLVARIQSIQEQGPGRSIVARDTVVISKVTAGAPSDAAFTAFDF